MLWCHFIIHILYSKCVTLEEYNNATGENITQIGLWSRRALRNLAYKSQAEEKAQLRTFLEALGYSVEIHDVTLINYRQVVDGIVASSNLSDCRPVVLNMAAGYDMYDGCVGATLIEALEKSGLPFTGGDSKYYSAAMSKHISKRLFQENGVPTAPFVVLRSDSMDEDLQMAEELFGYPMIVKAEWSYAQTLVSNKSIVFDAQSAKARALDIWDLAMGRVFAERFVEGREFTVHVAQLFDEESGEPKIHVYEAQERVFLENITRYNRILENNDYWDSILQKHPEINDPTANFSLEQLGEDSAANYYYDFAPTKSQDILKQITLNAFKAVGGQSYGRADIRAEKPAELEKWDWQHVKFYVLEINAHPYFCPNTDSPFGELFNLMDGRDMGPSTVQFLEGILHTAIYQNNMSMQKNR